MAVAFPIAQEILLRTHQDPSSGSNLEGKLLWVNALLGQQRPQTSQTTLLCLSHSVLPHFHIKSEPSINLSNFARARKGYYVGPDGSSCDNIWKGFLLFLNMTYLSK